MKNIHGTCVSVGGRGVLLLGKSGSGKSDLALRLMDDGARLVADDRTDLFVQGGALMARAPRAIAGLIEIRGLGIIALPHAEKARVVLVVQLGAEGARLPKARFYKAPLKARSIPIIMMNGHAPAAPAKIRLALAAFSRNLFRDTFNPSKK